jgi:hypothetical protein
VIFTGPGLAKTTARQFDYAVQPSQSLRLMTAVVRVRSFGGRRLLNVRITPERWGNRPASLWIAKD